MSPLAQKCLGFPKACENKVILEKKKTALLFELKCVFTNVTEILTDIIAEILSGILLLLKLKVIHYCNGITAKQILLLAWHYKCQSQMEFHHLTSFWAQFNHFHLQQRAYLF